MFCDPAATDEKEIFHKAPRRPERRAVVWRNPRTLAGTERCMWEASRDSLAVRAAARGVEGTRAGGWLACGTPRNRTSEREFTSRDRSRLFWTPGWGSNELWDLIDRLPTSVRRGEEPDQERPPSRPPHHFEPDGLGLGLKAPAPFCLPRVLIGVVQQHFAAARLSAGQEVGCVP